MLITAYIYELSSLLLVFYINSIRLKYFAKEKKFIQIKMPQSYYISLILCKYREETSNDNVYNNTISTFSDFVFIKRSNFVDVETKL